jgi:coenzyme F420 hydrogenase subunit beta
MRTYDAVTLGTSNPATGSLGSSLVLMRTDRGREIVRGAVNSGYAPLEPAGTQKFFDSQRNLLAKRGAIWGRITTLRAFGLPAPKLKGFHLFNNWWRLSLNEKLRSTLGTSRRITSRKYFRPLELVAEDRL